MANMKKFLAMILAMVMLVSCMAIAMGEGEDENLLIENPPVEDPIPAKKGEGEKVVIIEDDLKVPLAGPSEEPAETTAPKMVNVTLVKPKFTRVVQVEKGSLMEAPYNDPAQSGYVILYWFVEGDVDEAQFFFYNAITEDIVLVAKYVEYVAPDADEKKDENNDEDLNDADLEDEDVEDEDGEEEFLLDENGDVIVPEKEEEDVVEEKPVVSVTYTLLYEGDKIYFGNEVTLKANVTEVTNFGLEGVDLTFQWQLSLDDGATWADIAGETGRTMMVISSPEVNTHAYRVVVNY